MTANLHISSLLDTDRKNRIGKDRHDMKNVVFCTKLSKKICHMYTMIVSSRVIPTNDKHVHRHCKHKTREAMLSIIFCRANTVRNPLSKCALDCTKCPKADVDQG